MGGLQGLKTKKIEIILHKYLLPTKFFLTSSRLPSFSWPPSSKQLKVAKMVGFHGLKTKNLLTAARLSYINTYDKVFGLLAVKIV